jgi:hypothetical protein
MARRRRTARRRRSPRRVPNPASAGLDRTVLLGGVAVLLATGLWLYYKNQANEAAYQAQLSQISGGT